MHSGYYLDFNGIFENQISENSLKHCAYITQTYKHLTI